MTLRGRSAAAFIWAVSAAGLAAAAAAFVAFYPPPSTFASLYPPDNPHVRPGSFTRPACNGIQCRLCPENCFLPEGVRGKCKVRINYGGKIKTLIYSREAD